MLVSLQNVSAFLPGDKSRTPVLHELCWDVKELEHTVICGRNGAGKSTLLRLVHGELPFCGTVLWQQNGCLSASRITGLQISGLLSPAVHENVQNNAPFWTVRDYLANTTDASGDLAKEWLDKLQCPEIFSLPLGALSQGQLRLAVMARTLLRGPKLLLLDEFATGLDYQHKKAVWSILKDLSESTTIICVSHRQDRLPDWFSKTWELRNGRLHKPEKAARQPTVAAAPTVSRLAGNVLVRLKNVTVYVNRTKVLHNLNWEVRQGEHWQIGGANGSGKSTLLRLLAGDEFAAAGGTLEHLKNGAPLRELAAIRKNVHLVSDQQQATYGYPVTALELICSGFANTTGLYEDCSEQEKARAMHILQQVFPEEDHVRLASRSIRSLSGGQLRRLFLGRALAATPELLLLDEPFTGLDCESRSQFLHLLAELAQKGIGGYRPTMILVSHEDCGPWVCQYANMEAGRLRLS